MLTVVNCHYNKLFEQSQKTLKNLFKCFSQDQLYVSMSKVGHSSEPSMTKRTLENRYPAENDYTDFKEVGGLSSITTSKVGICLVTKIHTSFGKI